MIKEDIIPAILFGISRVLMFMLGGAFVWWCLDGLEFYKFLVTGGIFGLMSAMWWISQEFGL